MVVLKYLKLIVHICWASLGTPDTVVLPKWRTWSKLKATCMSWLSFRFWGCCLSLFSDEGKTLWTCSESSGLISGMRSSISVQQGQGRVDLTSNESPVQETLVSCILATSFNTPPGNCFQPQCIGAWQMNTFKSRTFLKSISSLPRSDKWLQW